MRTKVGNGILLVALKHHTERVGVVFGLENQHVVLVHHFEDLSHVVGMDPQ